MKSPIPIVHFKKVNEPEFCEEVKEIMKEYDEDNRKLMSDIQKYTIDDYLNRFTDLDKSALIADLNILKAKFISKQKTDEYQKIIETLDTAVRLISRLWSKFKTIQKELK